MTAEVLDVLPKVGRECRNVKIVRQVRQTGEGVVPDLRVPDLEQEEPKVYSRMVSWVSRSRVSHMSVTSMVNVLEYPVQDVRVDFLHHYPAFDGFLEGVSISLVDCVVRANTV